MRSSLHAILTVQLLAAMPVAAQTPPPVPPTITVRSSLVLVPALVKTKAGDLVFSLTPDDFLLTDNGIPQKLRLDPDTDSQPLALVVIAQTGGAAASHLPDYRHLDAILDAVIGNVPHRIAVVTFDSTPHLDLGFTPNTGTAANTLDELYPGDPGAAILDALTFGIDLLRKQPSSYRRAVILLSETVDNGSHTSFDDAIRAVDDTNTSIYSFGFSSTKSALKHEGAKLPNPFNATPYSRTPYPPGGCMSKDPNADPDAHGKRSIQALDCADDLLPPLRLARVAFLAAKDSLQRNVPESVAQLTGGEFFPFKDPKSLSRELVTLMNDVPNHYVLSFVPQSPTPGIHALTLTVKAHPDLNIKTRTAYWVDAPLQ